MRLIAQGYYRELKEENLVFVTAGLILRSGPL